MLELVVLNPPKRRSRRKKKAAPRKKKRKKAGKKSRRKKTSSSSKRKVTVARKKTTRRKKGKLSKAARSRAARKGWRRRKAKKAARSSRKKRRRNPYRSGPGSSIWKLGSRTPSGNKKRTRTKAKKKARRRYGKKAYRPSIRRSMSSTARRRVGRRIAGKIRGLKIMPNPGRGFKAITSTLKQVFTVQTGAFVAQGLAGATLALMIPPYAAKITRQSAINRGYVGILSSAVASVLAAVAARSVGWNKAAPAILAGGLLATGSKLLKKLLPARYARYIPSISVGASGMPSATSLRPLPGASGLGMAMSADQLIHGEARAQGIGDWLSMKGMGQAIPRGSIAGGVGMGDYLYFQQLPQAPQAIGIPSFAPAAGEEF